MPKDIRSYFTTAFKTTKKADNTPIVDVKNNRKRKKNLRVLSDSDEEPPVKSPKEDTGKKVPLKQSDKTSKYFEINKASVHSLLGDAPVKRKLAPSKVKTGYEQGEINEVIIAIDDDDDDDEDNWEKSFINGSKNFQGIASSSNKNDEVVEAKRRKLDSHGALSEGLEVLTNKKKPENIKNAISNNIVEGEHTEIVKRSPQKQSISSPRKIGSPTKSNSPQKQKTPSPQKSITSYLSPSPRINKLNITKTAIKSERKLNDLCSGNKTIEETKITNKEATIETGCCRSKTSLTKEFSKSSEHTLSPENSDDELMKVTSSSNKVSTQVSTTKVNDKIVEHTLSPDDSDDEETVYKSCNSKNYTKKKESESKTVNKSIKFGNTSKVGSSKTLETSGISPIKPKPSLSGYDLWVEKYRPTSLKNIIGQQGEKSNVNKLLKWLKKWFENHSGNKKIPRPSPWAKDDTGAYFKAALLSGPPGIGKTTTAHLVCKELNMDVVEFNASDTRSKKLLNQEISELLSSKSLSPYLLGGAATTRRHVLLMDEVDGMAGNEDRGGIQELISLIKNTKIPIICMCNDRNHPKIRSLVNYCFDLRFNRPRIDQIKGAMLSICFKEQLKIKPEVLAEIIASTNHDIRLVLNHLSVLSANKEQSMNLTNKEIKLGPWDVLRKVFSHAEQKTMSIHDKSDLFFHDYSIAPLFVHENYLNVTPYSAKGKTKYEKMDLYAKAADSLCCGDMVEKVIRTYNAWSLLPAQAIFSSVIPGHLLSGHVSGMINFPAWFGKNSKKNKFDRLGQEIQLHTRLKASVSKEAIVTDYAYALRDAVVNPMVKLGIEGVDSSLQVLHEYSLFREDITSLSELTSWPHIKDPFSSLDSKIKAAFTRAYNKHPVLPPFSISGAAIKKGRKGTIDDDELEILTIEEGSEEQVRNEGSDQEEEDDLSADGMINIKKKDKQENAKKERSKKEAASSSKPRGGKNKQKMK